MLLLLLFLCFSSQAAQVPDVEKQVYYSDLDEFATQTESEGSPSPSPSSPSKEPSTDHIVPSVSDTNQEQKVTAKFKTERTVPEQK